MVIRQEKMTFVLTAINTTKITWLKMARHQKKHDDTQTKRHFPSSWTFPSVVTVNDWEFRYCTHNIRVVFRPVVESNYNIP